MHFGALEIQPFPKITISGKKIGPLQSSPSPGAFISGPQELVWGSQILGAKI
jgi:hypothetical protein